MGGVGGYETMNIKIESYGQMERSIDKKEREKK